MLQAPSIPQHLHANAHYIFTTDQQKDLHQIHHDNVKLLAHKLHLSSPVIWIDSIGYPLHRPILIMQLDLLSPIQNIRVKHITHRLVN